MEIFSCDCVVIGAGVIGLAVARELTLAGLAPLVLERNSAIGAETSSRNSEVIHAGIYYSPGSLKARLCRAGRDELYAYCAQRGVPALRIGKLIVANSAGQEAELSALGHRAVENGVDDLVDLTRRQALALEPEISCTSALYSPSTGIIDSHRLMHSLMGDVLDGGGQIVLRAEAEQIRAQAHGFRLFVANAGETFGLDCRVLVNAAGLYSASVARRVEGLAAHDIPELRYAKGSYARLTRRSPFTHLIYPVPEPGGLGVHVTLDLAGSARFGPDVEWLDTSDPAEIRLGVDDAISERFAPRIRAYWPQVTPAILAPDYAGVRPKLNGPGAAAADFRIDGPELHGIAGLINLYGIESPGLTASLAIAREVVRMLGLGSTPGGA